MNKGIFDKFPKNGLIKTVDLPPPGIEADQKVKLNRRGNELFNQGDIEGARRLFQTTGYSDGLIRVGEYYMAQSRPIDALKMFKLAKDEKHTEAVLATAATVIQNLLKDQEEETK